MPDTQERRVAVIIEDDADIRNLLAALLNEAGFETHLTASGLEGLEAVREFDPILTTLDISLPGIDGFEVARRLRAFSSTYLIMLSARTEEIDTLMGLDAGADDYLTKPFRPRELRARVEAMLRRTRLQSASAATALSAQSAHSPADPVARTASATSAMPRHPWTSAGDTTVANAMSPGVADGDGDGDAGWLEHNGLRLNPGMRMAELDGEPVELTRSEFDLMLAIMQRRRRVISKNELVLELRGDTDVGGYVSDSDRRSVEVHLANLRRKLNDPVSSPRFVQTVRGVGYRLASPQA
ncbi:DNA-binding response OmpR family regulator [Friedmanniella endophytica]|uniref:DNA-binding response OmpR family regulator n=1 Tax=Microlunatus kandeliicorticis TaxID=1759536 RepID=A0A7W3IRF2_9ACTN|nr:response regulator transcription factor [Microlunatus kandeliicorticis]MBA8793894.1 DNA-binding response OmpR family regulator [Microlunatus kandeliicorticis]